MIVNKSWLQEYVEFPLDTQAVCAQLTQAGLEVDAIEPVAGVFTGVVVACINEILPHPNADKLSLCKVDDGQQVLEIVCGANNIYTGMKVPLAKIGAQLPGGFKIKKSKLRGQVSYGMLCSEQELGLAESAKGIFELPDDLTLGKDIREALDLDDVSIDIDLTPNRADCLSVYGIAREVAAINQTAIDEICPPSIVVDETIKPMPVKLQNQAASPRYCARVIKNVNVNTPTPFWMREKLRRCGLKPVSLVVDVTNLMLLQYGQPMHAFDLDKINDQIIIRNAKEGEQLTLLDQTEITLTPQTLVIADNYQPVALAGIMGGLDSSVSADTRHIILESAYFNPVALSGKARQYGLHTDSSHRFERGVDPKMCDVVMAEATRLILEVAGGQASKVTEVSSPEHLPEPKPIQLKYQKIKRLLGFDLPVHFVTKALTHLGMKVETVDKEAWQVTPPTYRFDIAIEQDLIEELVRLHGYENIPESLPSLQLRTIRIPEGVVACDEFKQQLIHRGYQESISYSFIDKVVDEMFFNHSGLALSNPISADLSVMRQSIIPSLLTTLQANLAHQTHWIRLFETGTIFIPTNQNICEKTAIAGIVCGHSQPLNWQHNQSVDFYEVKGDVEALLSHLSNVTFECLADNKYLHPGQSAAICYNGEQIGVIGLLHPTILKHYDIKNVNPIVFELDYDQIKSKSLPQLHPVSKYPSISRDISIIVGQKIPFSEVKEAVESVLKDIDYQLRLFDVFSGQNVPENKKSLAINLILQPHSKTLIHEEVDEIINKVVSNLKNTVGAVLRE